MENDRSSTDEHQPLSPDAAFVVHLVTTDAPEIVRGRIEHIVSGQWTRFASAAELVRFMRITSAIAAATTTAATPAPLGDRGARNPR